MDKKKQNINITDVTIYYSLHVSNHLDQDIPKTSKKDQQMVITMSKPSTTVGPRRRSGWTTSISSRTLEPPWGGVHIMSNLTIISWSHADEPAFFLNAWRIWPWHWSWLSWRSSFRPTISVIPWRNRPRLWPGSPWRVVIIIMILLMIPVPVSSFHCLEKTTV